VPRACVFFDEKQKEPTMKTWIDQLIALVGRRKRSPILRRLDWRGRPLVGSPAELTAMVSVSKNALYATLCLPFDAEEKRQSDG
jgi:hypothetical protein